MLFNSRSVALLLATCVAFFTAFFLVLVINGSVVVPFVGTLASFFATFTFSFLLLEFLIFKELRKVYSVFNRFGSKNLTLDTNLNVPIKQMSQDLYAFANTKEQEIEKLKELESFRREFLADISHELKTPVFAAQGFIHTLIDGAKDDENVRDRFLEKAAKSLDDLDTLVQDLITISQMETGETKMQLTRFDLAKMLDDVIEQFEVKLKAQNTQIHVFKKNFEDYSVVADEVRINQVLKNLIDNAIKYGRAEAGEIVVTLKNSPDDVSITVADNGPGIPEEHHPRIFQRFYRVEKSRSKEKGGSGLGLSIVKHIIEAHNSRITLTSKANEGASFTFKLPKKVLLDEATTV